ncbi:hypothetical protein BEN44_19675 [Leptospira interrogans serovar Ricardi]|uniref:hypothetical protein n=1 Tax=Leptospira interrogans TaxID=173 RepID=UPI00215940C2|nr:hypothetical protein [Leptospira interrogans]MCR8640777.1 hypothetical protein [Leptospira interrogans serovar Ricardi]
MGVSCEFKRIAKVGIVSDKSSVLGQKNPTKIFHASVEIYLKIYKSIDNPIQDIFIFTLNYFQKNPSQITAPYFEITQWRKLIFFLEKYFSDTEISTALSEPNFIFKNDLKFRLVKISRSESFKSLSL